MFYHQRKFLAFLLKSTNQHGVHSPFIFNLVTKGLYRKINAKKWESFQNIKNQLLDTKSFKKVTNFDIDSNVFKANTLQTSKIEKIGAISNKKTRIIIKIIKYFKPKSILEIGTSLGVYTTALKAGNKTSNITTLENCKETSKVAKNIFENNHLEQIKIITGKFSKTISDVTKNSTFDCILFNENHTKKETLVHFNNCVSTIHNNSFFIFNDIYRDTEMESTWSEIKNNPKVTVTVDLFYYGIVFFRKEQAKEHFKIRV